MLMVNTVLIQPTVWIRRSLETFIKNGIESTRYLAVDEARVPPDASRYYKGGKPDLQLFDKQFNIINPDDKVAVNEPLPKRF